MTSFQISDVTRTIDQPTRNLIAELILAWARYDSLVTHWTFRAFGMDEDAGPILLGNMDTKTKLDRLKALYSHFDVTPAVERLKELSKLHRTHVEVRNAVCHKSCGGHQKSDPDRIIFASAKTLPKKPGQMEIALIHVDQFRDAIQFASSSADQIIAIVDALVAQIEELRARES